MNYRAIPLECYCGEVPEHIMEVGFTDDEHLIIHYWCSACRRVIFRSLTFEECRGYCVPQEEDASQMAAGDARFLQQMGIRCSE